MRADEFLTEAYVITGVIGKINYLISDHVLARGDERASDKNAVNKIIKRLPYIKPQLVQMLNFERFYLRDNDTQVELGCRIAEEGEHQLKIWINTLVQRPVIRQSDTPTIVVNPKL